MATILDEIVQRKRQEVDAAQAARPAAELERRIADAPPTRDFRAALAAGNDVRLIAEVKRASPSAGVIRTDFNPVEIARRYADAGAACISVLTDEHFFQGSLDYLQQIRAAVDLPLLRKDFIIDSYQLLEARAAGADCVLLIAECLTADRLRSLVAEAAELDLQALVELYEPENLPAVLESQTPLVGVNNRDLRSFTVDLEHTIRLRQQIPPDRLVVGESGIKTHADVQRLGAAGVKGVLVGESLMRQDDIAAAVRSLLGTS